MAPSLYLSGAACITKARWAEGSPYILAGGGRALNDGRGGALEVGGERRGMPPSPRWCCLDGGLRIRACPTVDLWPYCSPQSSRVGPSGSTRYWSLLSSERGSDDASMPVPYSSLVV